MENQRREEYFGLFEELLNLIATFGELDREALVGVIVRLRAHFRLTKGVVEFYRSLSHERMHDGDVYEDQDGSRADDKIVLQKRFITNTSAVTIGTVYAAADAEPLTEEEQAELDIVLRVLMNFVRRRRLQNAIERLGYHDDRGYPNFRAFLRAIDKLIQGDGVYGHVAIHFNLRHFSLINREIGRDNADKVMWKYFKMLQALIGEEGVVSRLGGDNFLAVFPERLLEPILTIMKGVPVEFDPENEKRVLLSASAGVFRFPEGFQMVNSGEVMDRLIPSLGMAKREENRNVIFYSEEMTKLKERQANLQREFPEALKNGEFHVYYQPKVDVNSGEIIGAEALCRWIRDGRVIPPTEFIPTLEQNTDVCELDFYVLDKVCQDLKRWLTQGKRVVRVSVNFSRKHMLDPDLLEHIMEIIERNGVPHDYVEVELTETTTDVEFKDLKRVVGGLQKAGISTSVDDFGMGYSSLNLIREIPWNVLKIDKCFLPTDFDEHGSTTSLMYKHVIAMAKAIGLECITEGVETEGQVKLLKENGCQYAQGFYYDKPLPVEEFEKRLDRRFYG